MRLKRNRIRRESEGKKIGVIFSLGLLIIISIGCGFLLTQHIIIPTFLNDYKEEKNIVKKVETKKLQEKEENQKNIKVKTDTLALDGFDIFSIQIGSFATRENAQNMINQLYEKKVSSFILEENGYKVITGVTMYRNDADILIENIKKEYEEAFILSKSVPGKNIRYNKEDKSYIQVFKEENKKFVEILKNMSKKIQEEKNIGNIQSFQIYIDGLNEIENKMKKEKVPKSLKTFQNEWINIVRDFSKELTGALKSEKNQLLDIENIFIKKLYEYSRLMSNS